MSNDVCSEQDRLAITRVKSNKTIEITEVVEVEKMRMILILCMKLHLCQMMMIIGINI